MGGHRPNKQSIEAGSAVGSGSIVVNDAKIDLRTKDGDKLPSFVTVGRWVVFKKVCRGLSPLSLLFNYIDSMKQFYSFCKHLNDIMKTIII